MPRVAQQRPFLLVDVDRHSIVHTDRSSIDLHQAHAGRAAHTATASTTGASGFRVSKSRSTSTKA